ncbi:MAG: hypothetical protein Q8M92_03070, partial [Candidatus Subteraquimicrobiales bacterium]|nr:hypothetical protein [Candidatus Subteraquimicrobiales bacterium]
MNCQKCSKPMSDAAIMGGYKFCDLCTVMEESRRDNEYAYKKRIEKIPQEYREGVTAAKIYAGLGITRETLKEWNMFIIGDRAKIQHAQWSILYDMWSHQSAARLVSFIAWFNEYKGATPAEKWEKTCLIVDYDGLLILNLDTMFGITDQSVLYSIMQIRRDRGKSMCLIYVLNTTDGDVMKAMQ